jgi:hypothetical protein
MSDQLVEQIFEKRKADNAARLKAAATEASQITLKAVIGGAAGDVNKLDLDGEFIGKADLCKMAFDFVSAEGRTFKANHSEPLDCTLVESWVGAPIISDGDALRTLKADETLAEDMNVVGINIEKGNETHWFLSFKPSDPEVAEIAKAGGIAGGSWGAFVSKTEV